MIYLTTVGETPSTIASDLLGGADYGNSFADAIRSANRNNIAHHLVSDLRYGYAPFRPIWIPGFSSLDSNSAVYEGIIRRIDRLSGDTRMRLALAMQRGADLNILVGATKAIQQHNNTGHHDAKIITSALAGNTAVESGLRTAERVEAQAEHFHESMSHLNQATKKAVDVFKAHGASSVEFRTAREELQLVHRETMLSLSKDAKLFSNRLSAKATRHMMSAKHEFMLAKKKGIFISDLEDVKYVEKIFKCSNWLSKRFMAFSIILGVDEVYETFKEGGDAFTKSAGIGLELGFAYTVGVGLIALFTPAGWVTLIGTAFLEGAAIAGFGTGIEKFGESMGHKAEQTGGFIASEVEKGYQWLKEKFYQLL